MAFRVVEIICAPCAKCDEAERRVKTAVKQVEIQLKMKVPYELRRTHDLRRLSDFSGGSRPPLIVINGSMEYSGRVPDPSALAAKIISFIRMG